MTELGEAAGVLAPPRRRDAAATRATILEAAKTAFAVTGYDRTSLRDIAALAGSDVALIPRYFGGKEGLFTEALKATIAPDRLRDWDRRRFSRDVAEMMAGAADIADPRTRTFQFLLQAATSPTTAPLLGRAVQERFLAPIRDWLGEAAGQEQARVLAAVYIGFLVERLIRGVALEGPERTAFVERVTAVIDGVIGAA
ncbi:MAG: TetR family transcriptional regulator [Phenylobacterium sp.]